MRTFTKVCERCGNNDAWCAAIKNIFEETVYICQRCYILWGKIYDKKVDLSSDKKYLETFQAEFLKFLGFKKEKVIFT